VIGRAATSDVQVPSAAVGHKHCVLFVHEGRWVVQDVAPGGAGTYVNGAKVGAAAYLRVGDAISLGADEAAPSVDIDPAGAAEGRTGQPAVAVLPPAADSAAGPPYVAPQPVSPAGYPAYPAYPGSYPVPVSQVPGQWPQYAAPAAVPEGSIPDWPSDATPRYSRPRRKHSSGGSGGVIVGVFLTLLITAGTGYWLYRQRQATSPVTQSKPLPTRPPAGGTRPRTEDDPAGAPPSIFTPADARPTPASRASTRPAPTAAAGGSPSPNPNVSAPPTPSPESDRGPSMESDTGTGASTPVPGEDTSSQDAAEATPSAGDDPAWKQVEAARFHKDEAKAILQFDDYARTHPGASADKIQQYTETMLDRIWFERIENLCEQREDLNKKIQEVDKDMAEETDAAYKTRVLVPLRQQYVTRLQNIDEELTQNMKYVGKATPNLLDEAEIDRLRQGRDPQYYASWKGRVLAHVRRTHGELPWVTSKSR
jgi:hypothetical protein